MSRAEVRIHADSRVFLRRLLRSTAVWQDFSLRDRLRVFSAGAWHNFCLCAVAAALIFAMPTVSSPLYVVGRGVYVVSSVTSSVPVGSVITEVNGVSVGDQNSWREALGAAQRNRDAGYCMKLSDFTEGTLDASCCMPDFEGGLLCVERGDDLSCIRGSLVLRSEQCDPSDCASPGDVCVRPVLEPGLQLLRIGKALLAANPAVIYDGTVTSNFVPRWSWVIQRVPDILNRQMMYILSLSSALGLLNLLPVYFLDGSHIVEASFSPQTARMIQVGVSLLLCFNLLISVRLQLG